MSKQANMLFTFRKALLEKSIHNRWVPDYLLLEFINQRFQLPSELQFSKKFMLTQLNKLYPAMSSVPNIIQFDSNENVLLYRNKYQGIDGSNVNTFYITTTKGDVPKLPTTKNASEWKDSFVLKRLLAANRCNNAGDELPINQPSDKKRRHSMPLPSLQSPSPPPLVMLPPCLRTTDSTLSSSLLSTIHLQSIYSNYWESGEARRLFAPKEIHGATRDVLGIVLDRIDRLESASHKGDGWRLVVDIAGNNNQQESTSTLSENDILIIRYRSAYIAKALCKFVDEELGHSRWTWKKALQYAIDTMAEAGIKVFTSSETLRRWHKRLASSRKGTFFATTNKKNNLPPFFIANPDAMEASKKFGLANLKDMSVEKMHDFVHEQLIPSLMQNLAINISDDDDNNNPNDLIVVSPQQKEAYLKQFGLRELTLSTILRWMHAVGFRYKTREKHYYVDGHEKPETLAYRPVFTKEYLNLELRAHRWVQLTSKDAKCLEDQGLVATGSGYCYHDVSTSVDMVEYHVDLVSDYLPPPTSPFGGNLSVRRPANQPTVMFIGQDESIFKQFLFTPKMWTGPNRQRPLLPKDEGVGVMLSAFISREYGLLQEVDDDLLQRVNEKRLRENYADEAAAIEVYGTSRKAEIKKEKLPFLVYFEYGENCEGYWDYNRMVCQLEDVVDVLKLMHPTYHFVFLFDHSSGHAKQREDGLNAGRMNKSWGGKVPSMRATTIKQREGYIGPYPHTVVVGEDQDLVFGPNDEGPFNMDPEIREERRHDRVIVDETKIVERTCSQMRSDLIAKNIKAKGKSKKELVALCQEHKIPIITVMQKIEEGWEGKPKGLLQILWERGWIDTTNLQQYTVNGKKNALGIVDLTTSLRHLMANCHDFVHEEGMLQFIANKIGVQVMLTPKCHAELAGEGVEYMWGCAKNYYRKLALKDKKGKEKFMASVRHCLSNEVITAARVRKFARRARQYMIAYHVLDSGNVDNQTREDCLKYGPIALERLIVAFKTHRCAYDFDYKFIKLCCDDDPPNGVNVALPMTSETSTP